MQPIVFTATDKSGIDQIKELWEGLCLHHHDRSTSFKERYATMTFESRKKDLFKKLDDGEMFLEIAIDSTANKKAGYCLCIVTYHEEPEGEVESLFIDPAYRGKGIGDAFMKHALEWLDSKQVKTKRIVVAAGNEEVFPFYEKYGFFHKFSTLEQK
jgi:diamine N-acetyltransferase